MVARAPHIRRAISSSSLQTSIVLNLRANTRFLRLLGDRGRATLGERLAAALTLLTKAQGKKLVVFSGFSLGRGLLGLLRRNARVLALEHERGNETLNLRRLGLLLTSLGFKLTTVGVHVLANIILLGQREKLANLARTLRTAQARDFSVGQTRDIRVALLDNDQVKNGDFLGDNATTACLATAFTLATPVRAETARTLGHEQEHALVRHHALLHTETLLVVTTHDFEHVTLPFL